MSDGGFLEPAAVQGLVLELLSVESPQSDLEAVRACIAREIQPRLKARLFDRIVIDSAGNLLAQRDGPPASRPLLVYAYAATYPAAGMSDPFPACAIRAEEGIRLRGRGAAEQRAALATSLLGVQAFLASMPVLSRGLDFVISIAGEMGNHLVAAEFLEGHPLAAGCAVVASASNNQLCLGNLGRVDVHIAVHGRASHSSNPAAGVNAIDGARVLLNRLSALDLAVEDAELGKPTLAATFIESSPRASHTIPSRVDITLDRRMVPGETVPAVIAPIEACARELEPVRAEVRTGHVNYPNKVSPTSEIALAAAQALRLAGLPVEIVYKRSALDAGYFTQRGIDSIVFGPGDPTLGHADEEWVSLDQAVHAAEVYRALCQLICSPQ